jgi:hypothetical protein
VGVVTAAVVLLLRRAGGPLTSATAAVAEPPRGDVRGDDGSADADRARRRCR